MIVRFILGGFLAPGAPQDGPRAIQDTFFRLQEPPGALQEAFERPPEGVRAQDTIRIPFWTNFWTRFGSPGTSKISEICETFVKNQGFAIFSWGPFSDTDLGPSRAPFWDPLGPQDR